MSFFSDLFRGNFGNLGHDLFGSPTAIAETLGALALPIGGALLGPELLGASLLPTASEGIAGATGAIGGVAEAPASLGALFGGAGAAGGLGEVGATGGGALAEAAPDASIVDPTLNIPGLEGTGGGINTAGIVGGGPQFVPNPIQPDFASIGTGDQVLGGFGGGPYANIPGDLPSGGALSYETPATVPVTGASPVAGGGSLDTLPSIGPGGPIPNAPTTLAAPAATAAPAPQGFAANFTQNFNPSTIGGALGKGLANPLTDLGIAGLGYNLYQGYKQNQQLDQLKQTEATAAGNAAATAAQERAVAQPLFASGQELMKSLTTNTLPPQFQTQLKQIGDAARARIIQGYASRGMSSDPKQNSALAQDLSNVDQQLATQQTTMETALFNAGQQATQQATQLLNSGITATQLSSQIPVLMAELQQQLNQSASTALSNFAGALGGGIHSGQNVTLKL